MGNLTIPMAIFNSYVKLNHPMRPINQHSATWRNHILLASRPRKMHVISTLVLSHRELGTHHFLIGKILIDIANISVNHPWMKHFPQRLRFFNSRGSWYPAVIKHGNGKLPIKIGDVPIETSIEFGDFPASHVWLPEGQKKRWPHCPPKTWGPW